MNEDKEVKKPEAPKKPEKKKKSKVKLPKQKSINTEWIGDALLNFIVPLIALVVSLALGVLVLYPAYKSMPGLKGDIEQKETQKASLQKKLSDLNDLIDYKKSVDENSELVNKVLVTEPLVPELLNQIDGIARDSGLVVEKLSYSHGSAKKDEESVFNTVDVGMSVDGTYWQTITFMQLIENAARMINVDNLRYNTYGTEDNPDAIKVNLSLVAPYMYVESSAVTDDPLTLDIQGEEFLGFISMLKDLTYYELTGVISPEVEEALEEGPVEAVEEGEEVVEEGTEAPAETTSEETTPTGTPTP